MAIYFEARSEPLEGQVAVAQVILNRVADKRWPNSICSVVKQKHQFSFYWDGKKEEIFNWKAYNMAEVIADAAINNELPNIVGEALYYHTVYVHPNWNNKLQFQKVIGDHVFWNELK